MYRPVAQHINKWSTSCASFEKCRKSLPLHKLRTYWEATTAHQHFSPHLPPTVMLLPSIVLLCALTACQSAPLALVPYETVTVRYPIIVCDEGSLQENPPVDTVSTRPPPRSTVTVRRPIATATFRTVPAKTIDPGVTHPHFIRQAISTTGVRPSAYVPISRVKDTKVSTKVSLSVLDFPTPVPVSSTAFTPETDTLDKGMVGESNESESGECREEYVTETIPVYSSAAADPMGFVNPGPDKLPIAAKVKIRSKAEKRRDRIQAAVKKLREGGFWRNVFDDHRAYVSRVTSVGEEFRFLVTFRFKEKYLEELPPSNLVGYTAGLRGTVVSDENFAWTPYVYTCSCWWCVQSCTVVTVEMFDIPYGPSFTVEMR